MAEIDPLELWLYDNALELWSTEIIGSAPNSAITLVYNVRKSQNE